MKKWFYFAIPAIFIFLIDRLLKEIMLKKNKVIFNDGTFFGLFQGHNLFFIIISLIIMIALVLTNFYIGKNKINIALGLIFGSALSNLYDRFVYGSVIDYINLKIWPSFNLADLFIVVAILIIIFSLKKLENIS